MPLYGNNLDLNFNQLLNAKLQLLASDPASPVDGQVWINTTTWVLKARLNGTTRTLAHLANTLDQFGAPAADLSMASHKITNVTDGTANERRGDGRPGRRARSRRRPT
jgi:hypothetical protein